MTYKSKNIDLLNDLKQLERGESREMQPGGKEGKMAKWGYACALLWS